MPRSALSKLATAFLPVSSPLFPHGFLLPPSATSKLPTRLLSVASPWLPVASISALKVADTVAYRCFPIAFRGLPRRPQSYWHGCFPLLTLASPWPLVASLSTLKVTDTVASRCFPVAPPWLSVALSAPLKLYGNIVASKGFPVASLCFPQHPQTYRHRYLPLLSRGLPLPPRALKVTDAVASVASCCFHKCPQSHRHRFFSLLPYSFLLPPPVASK